MVFIVPVAQCKMNKTCNTGAKGLSVPVAQCKIKLVTQVQKDFLFFWTLKYLLTESMSAFLLMQTMEARCLQVLSYFVSF